jgi:hypothetical protein
MGKKVKIFRGLSETEFRSISKAGVIYSLDQTWKSDETWNISCRRTFFTRSREQADLFAIGAYIPGYGATGKAIELYRKDGLIRIPFYAYTLSIYYPRDKMKDETEFACRGDDEVFTTAPCSTRNILGLSCHRVWIQQVNKAVELQAAVYTASCPLWRIWKSPVLRKFVICEECNSFREISLESLLTTSSKRNVLVRLFHLQPKPDGQYVCRKAWLSDHWIEF